jgi:hypothetical protein
VSLVTKCVTGDFLHLTFNDVGREGGEGREGQKVLSKPSADSFAVGRRQKERERIWEVSERERERTRTKLFGINTPKKSNC